MTTQSDGAVAAKTRGDAWNSYLQKTYLKTASLMTKGGIVGVVLGRCKDGGAVKEIAYAYGKNLGIAFRVGGIVISSRCWLI